MNEKMKRRVARGLTVALTAGAVGFVGIQAALAHTHVAESSPADGARVEAAPTEVMVRFGDESSPVPQPAAVSEARLEVFDACGAPVHKGESELNMQESRVTIGSGGSASGRYETHWYATAADGAQQAGVIDFNVTGGAECTKAARADAKEDVDLGFDVVNLQSADTKRGAKVTVTTAAALKCSDLTDKQTLALKFDTGADDTSDVEGLFVCKAGKIVLELSSKDGSTGKLAVAQPSPTKLKVALTRHVLLGQVGVIAEATLDSTECEGKVCADRAPDLGWLNAF